jgi:hypothetical protein
MDLSLYLIDTDAPHGASVFVGVMAFYGSILLFVIY